MVVFYLITGWFWILNTMYSFVLTSSIWLKLHYLQIPSWHNSSNTSNYHRLHRATTAYYDYPNLVAELPRFLNVQREQIKSQHKDRLFDIVINRVRQLFYGPSKFYGCVMHFGYPQMWRDLAGEPPSHDWSY